MESPLAPASAMPAVVDDDGRAACKSAADGASDAGSLSAIDKVVFDACVSVSRGGGPPHIVALQFLFRHFDGMRDIRNADGESR